MEIVISRLRERGEREMVDREREKRTDRDRRERDATKCK